MGIKVYNSLPPEVKDMSHKIKKFKSSLREFLHTFFIHWKNVSILKQLYDNTLITKPIFIILSLVWNSEVCFHTYDTLYIMLKMIL
jgi:hypothetical protein